MFDVQVRYKPDDLWITVESFTTANDAIDCVYFHAPKVWDVRIASQTRMYSLDVISAVLICGGILR